jgi:hypothetical protein
MEKPRAYLPGICSIAIIAAILIAIANHSPSVNMRNVCGADNWSPAFHWDINTEGSVPSPANSFGIGALDLGCGSGAQSSAFSENEDSLMGLSHPRSLMLITFGLTVVVGMRRRGAVRSRSK